MLAWMLPGLAQTPPRPSSGSYVLAQSTLGASGAQASSASFLLGATASQPATVGVTTSSNYVLQSGVWTSAGVNYTLTVAGSGSGAGMLSGDFFTCAINAGSASGDCTETTGHGTVLSVIATPAGGDFFTGWSGCDQLSTTIQTADTCAVAVTRDVTASAAFIAPGGVSGRLWLDYDGSGTQDGGEPGIAAAEVTLSGAVTLSALTAADGGYGFAGLFPGDYTISVDDTTLPAGTVPTFDPDGVATPYNALLPVLTAQTNSTGNFGFQPFADLEITIEGFNQNDFNAVFNITVENLGPADATQVVVNNDLPAGVIILDASGCQEVPFTGPVCTLGDIPAGTSAAYSLVVTSDGSTSVMLTNTVSASATESDPDPGNNTASTGAFVVFPVPAVSLLGFALMVLLIGAAGLARVPRQR